MNKCFTDSSCDSDHVGPGEMLHAIKGFDLPQGLVCLLDGHWVRNPHSSRHSLDDFCVYEYVCMESTSISELQPFSRHTCKSADPEWKWILYQQQASLPDMLTPIKSMDSFAHTVVTDLEPSLKGDVRKATAELSFASVLSDAPKAEECLLTGSRKPHRVRMPQPSDSNAAMPTLKSTVSWQHVKDVSTTIPQWCQMYAEECDVAPSNWFAAVVSHRDHAHPENHDLPPLINSWTWREVCVADGYGDFHEGEAVLKLSAKGALDSGFSEPSIIPTTIQQTSVQDRLSYHLDDGETAAMKASNEKCFVVKKHDDEILGEALCRAQTRARLAEKLAAQALQERETLAHMLLREAWITCTYKQRAQALELQNRLLKLRSNLDVEVCTDGKSMRQGTEQKASMLRKLEQHKHRPRQGKRSLCGPSLQRKESSSNRSWKERVLISCTLGLAFVLGLSIAGIGLVIGWSMGWMMFP